MTFKLKCPPLIRRRERWMLTPWGWGVAIAIVMTILGMVFGSLYPFLAAVEPLPEAEILVVEGWLPDYALEAALAQFDRGNYRQLVTTGLPLERGSYLVEYRDFATLAAATLAAVGADRDRLVAVPGPAVMKDRTYASAVALREWSIATGTQVRAIDLISLGPHTRRSWLLFQLALSEIDVSVGAIAVEPMDYDPQRWWQSSAGVRSVISEAIAYLYARFFQGTI